MFDLRVTGRDNEHQERRENDGNQGEERAKIAIAEIAQADYPQTIGAGTDLSDGNRLSEVDIGRPAVGDEILVQAR